MDAQWLRDHIDELQYYIINFKEVQDVSKQNYQKQLDSIVDLERKALLMKEYFTRNGRQEKSIARIEKLHKEAIHRLSKFEQSDL